MINEKLKLRRRNLTIVELWKQNKTSNEIALKLKITRSTVMGVVNRAREKGQIDYRPKDKGPQTQKTIRIKKPTLAKTSIQKTPAPHVPKTSLTKSEDPLANNILHLMFPEKKKVSINPVKFSQLGRFMCKYVVSGNVADEYLFCGKERWEHRPYCEEHYKLCVSRVIPQSLKVNRRERIKF